MFIFEAKKNGKYKFRVTNQDRFRVIDWYEKELIHPDDMEYNWKFTNVSVFLKNPESFIFKTGEEYDFTLESRGIVCVWDKRAPKYMRDTPPPPSDETKMMLGLQLCDDGYYSSDSESDIEYSPPPKRKPVLPRTIVVSSYGIYKTIQLR